MTASSLFRDRDARRPRFAAASASRWTPRFASRFAPRFACALLAAAGVVAPLVGMPGCATYVTYPSEEAGRYAEGDVNSFPAPTVMRLAYNRVISLDLANDVLAEGQPIVVNFPQGTTRRTAELVSERIQRQTAAEVLLVGEAGFEDAAPYSVTRLWIRGDEARVDIVRPVNDDHLARDGSGYQRVTVRLRAGVKPWAVETVQEWPLGLAEEPELFGWPDEPADEPGAGMGSPADATPPNQPNATDEDAE